jgi:predicted nucleic acid-binding protein
VKTAVDTNVFSALLSGDEEAVSTMQTALEATAVEGLIVVSPPVYAELLAGWDSGVVDNLFSDKSIDVDWNLGSEVWRAAGMRYGIYARDRRRQRGDAGPRRILADFLIGAHALHLAHALLTSDTRIYGTYFSELEVISPQDSSSDMERPT